MSDSGLNLEIHQDNGKGKDNILFGYVNIDLAPFADLGRTARKFLLKDSKTNATIRITVDMRFIGGEQDWVAPPLAEGHLVTGVTELTGDEGFPDRKCKDGFRLTCSPIASYEVVLVRLDPFVRVTAVSEIWQLGSKLDAAILPRQCRRRDYQAPIQDFRAPSAS